MKVFSHLSVCILLACAVAQFHVARAQEDDGDMDMLMDEELELMMMFDPCGNSSNYTNATMMMLMNYSNFTLCNSTDVPTSSSAPSVAPSVAPAPTAGETPAPSVGATPEPTKPPTKSPTASPTKSPTSSPSASPSASPTISPEPSTSPSSSPSASPTIFTFPPTDEPTIEPTSYSCSLCFVYDTELDEDNNRKGVLGPDGELTTCQGLDNLLSFGDFTEDECIDITVGGDNGFGIDYSAYCECPGSSYSDICELCPGGIPEEKEGNNFRGLTCLQWNDWARAALDCCECEDEARDFCC